LSKKPTDVSSVPLSRGTAEGRSPDAGGSAIRHSLTHLTQRAEALDAVDPLAAFRDRFVVGDGLIYLDGNSLGRLPKAAIVATRNLVEDEWANELVLGWEHWIDQGVAVGDKLAPLIGASTGEVAVCDQTSVNLYKVASAALTASGRTDIVTDRGNFPSDRYILEGIATAHGGKIVWLDEDPTTAQIAQAATETVGVVSLSHVAYRSGMMHDGAAVTEAVHDAGAYMVWDLAHSAGSVPVTVNDWDADLAIGCTYKYLNGGPGAPGFLYVRKDLQTVLDQPIPGWYSHANQFAMATDYDPASDIRRFIVGTPPMASLVATEVGIDVTAEAGIDALRAKSLLLTDLFMGGIDALGDTGLTIVTPRDHAARGSHVTLAHENAYQISQALRAHRVIPDFREPNLVRFGFTPLYTTFTEVAQAIGIISTIMESQDYRQYPTTRLAVT
jgi:kynureninase